VRHSTVRRPVLVLSLFLLTLPVLASAQGATVQGTPPASRAERHKWWLSSEVKTEVGLTAPQSQELESIFQSVLPRLRSGWEELDRLEQEVSRLMTDGAADEGRVSTAIDRAESARASLNKTRTLMLFRMYRVLTPDQRVKLKSFHDRRERERRSPAGSGSR
jgi:Spy/CpxP family protein refolding chaperone